MENEGFTSKVTLCSDESRTWDIVFQPTELASFHQPIELTLGGWDRKYFVYLDAECDIPRIDSNPAVMFNKVGKHRNIILLHKKVDLVKIIIKVFSRWRNISKVSNILVVSSSKINLRLIVWSPLWNIPKVELGDFYRQMVLKINSTLWKLFMRPWIILT